MIYPSGAVVSYSYDSSGRVDSIDVAGHSLLSNVSYQPFGDIDQFTFAGGNVVNRQHDLDGRIEQLSLGPAAAIPDAGARTYVYDALNRLTGASLSSTLSLGYAYDAIGDRTQDAVNGAQTLYSYAPLTHRLTSKTGASGATYAYDASGNQIVRDSVSLNYDARGRMTSVSGGATASYVVNGRGERIQKSNGSATVRFVYDEAGRLVGEYDGSLVPIQEYVYLNELPVAVVRPAGANDFSIYQLYADQLGTPRSVIDPTRNLEVWRWGLTGSAFGDHAADNDPDGDGVGFLLNLRFPGQYYDSEMGLNYNLNRDYDPTTGRYIESDPIGLWGGLNSYAYVNDNPLVASDPTGLKARICCRKISAIPALGHLVVHCFIDSDSGGQTGLHGDWDDPDAANGEAFIRNNNPFNDPSAEDTKCGPWTDNCDTDDCVKKAIAGYPNPSKYSAVWGPNSNTFASTVANACHLKKPNFGWARGWGHSPASPYGGGK
jgi:RHS repeat-associated protein